MSVPEQARTLISLALSLIRPRLRSGRQELRGEYQTRATTWVVCAFGTIWPSITWAKKGPVSRAVRSYGQA